ncbi:MAG: glycosyl hydrolase family 32 [Opitutus sp.]|nr:glycosyl hydrolase family 32 [Opitutus sp.]
MKSPALAILFLLGVSAAVAETLYNGIVLPVPWPPRRSIEELRRGDVMAVPYLKTPPAVIPIDVGRQLLVDDFLIQETTLKRTFHKTQPYDGNPVLRPDKRWERIYQNPKTAMAFSDGAWWDPKDQLFKMWYMAASFGCTAYATSRDGLHWDKPVLDVRPRTNIVMLSTQRDSSTIWLDHEATDPAQRWKFFQFNRDSYMGTVHTSPDGIHWSEPVWTGYCADRTTFFHNPFRKKWVFSLRDEAFKGPWDYKSRPVKPIGRSRRYVEADDFVPGSKWQTFAGGREWQPGEPVHWLASDRLDSVGIPEGEMKAELYNFDATPYESLMLGLFSILHDNSRAGRPKINDIGFGFSRDGFHWDRPFREAVIPVADDAKAWNVANIQSVGGGCCIVGDKLYFYHSGRSSGLEQTGVAFLRRDGFASMDGTGALTTRPVRFSGKHLFVNAAAAAPGEVRAEIIGADGRVVTPFSAANCEPVTGDRTKAPLRWKGAADLSAVAGQPVRIRFQVKNGSLFAFWVSPDASGASHGYVAAGGPGFTGARDTKGR